MSRGKFSPVRIIHTLRTMAVAFGVVHLTDSMGSIKSIEPRERSWKRFRSASGRTADSCTREFRIQNLVSVFGN